jgi:hypothetical protein
VPNRSKHRGGTPIVLLVITSYIVTYTAAGSGEAAGYDATRPYAYAYQAAMNTSAYAEATYQRTWWYTGSIIESYGTSSAKRLPKTGEAKTADRKAALEDILWALLNSK